MSLVTGVLVGGPADGRVVEILGASHRHLTIPEHGVVNEWTYKWQERVDEGVTSYLGVCDAEPRVWRLPEVD